MPDFSNMLRKPAGEAKKPKALPIGDYEGVVKSYELGDSNKNKTPYLRVTLVLTAWPQQFTAVDIPEDVELSKRQLRKDIYITEDALWRLDELIRSCGIIPNGRPYEEVLPELIGQPVMVDVRHYINQQSGEVGNSVESVVGVNGKGIQEAPEEYPSQARH
jgi:hypothetical protein